MAALVQPEARNQGAMVKLPCSEEESALRSRTQETFCHCRKREKEMSDCNQEACDWLSPEGNEHLRDRTQDVLLRERQL